MFNIFGKLLDSNEREINSLKPKVAQINDLEKKFEKIKDVDLKKKTEEFRERLSKGEGLDDLLPEAFSLVREASKRTIGQRHFDVQLIGGIILHQGKIAEMKTGEGKTLVATLPLYLNAIEGKGAHLVTVNDYLAQRDAEWMGPIYHLLGLSVGVLNHEKSYIYDPNPQTPKTEEAEVKLEETTALSPEEGGLGTGKFLREVTRQEAYRADITYGTNNEFGFDYLRDNMVWELKDMAQREPNYAIVDEVDSILIDEARTPLIISAAAQESTEKYFQFATLVEKLVPQTDYITEEKTRSAALTEIGISKVERTLGVQNLYEKEFDTIHHIEEALKAKTMYHKDRDYVVKDGQVIIVDEFTGRMLPGRRYSEGLHQAIEAKEGVEIQRESRTLATISFQNLFRLYKNLSGMTGTAATSAEEFHKVYELDVVIIPTHKTMIRGDNPDQIFKTERAKYEAVVREIEECHKKGQPVLVGTTSIERNELIDQLLQRKGITHEVLNAKNHLREAQIIAKAGERGAVTVATNMAGRGVDIKLGEKVVEFGGLHIVGTERHEARRIDNQLRGRSGRQGDPGSSRFFVSLQDDIMRLFGGEQVAKMMSALKIPEDMPIENSMVSKAIENAQSRVEGHNFDIRKHLKDYDDVMNKHREAIYGMRRRILAEPEKLKGMVLEKIEGEIATLVLVNQTEAGFDYDKIIAEFATIVPFDEQSQKQIREQLSAVKEQEKIEEALKNIDHQIYEAREKQLGEEVSKQIEKVVLLSTIDTLWMNHLDDIDDLREGIGLRGYGQRDPLVEYKEEAFKMFESLLKSIDSEVARRIFKVSVQAQPQQPRPVQQVGGEPQASVANPGNKKIGRNDPCPCGSGLKYKKCGLINNSTHQENLAKEK
ncbi:MAG: preprotein translocase subunit SecA [Candidatus Woykebacteria bacterium RBG_13_40_7b]|uniref:Protein translocase subunit SecA n=1 Tax=Candidatus Woykebacteria bacterium RBG_13_40_7b TaxID=1802594 RepID=A0A1G1W866_9BACT|nr:MAG: preprotein translocase subunit SecA [Candidatus Woykebacteria bacterium RBG_13_40_7b]